MPFTDPDYAAALKAVTDATTRLGIDVGNLATVVFDLAKREAAIGALLAAAPSPADVKTAAGQATAHAATLDQASTALEGISSTLIMMDPTPVVPPIVVPAPVPVPIVPVTPIKGA